MTATPPEAAAQCQPGPGEVANIYVVTVETVGADSFSGPAAIRAGGPVVETVTVDVTRDTEWHSSYAQSLADLKPGAEWVQAVGVRQDDCSVKAERIFTE